MEVVLADVLVVVGLVVVVTGLDVVEAVEVVDLEVAVEVGFVVVVGVLPLLFALLENVRTRGRVRSSSQLTVTHRISPFHSCLRRPRQQYPSSQPGSSHRRHRTRAVHH